MNGVTNGSFVIPTQGETAADVWYRIHLTVTDSGGQTQTNFVDVVPRTASITLKTIPPGLQLTLDGQPLAPPASMSGVVGMDRSVGSISPQTLNGTNYTFASWSDGGAATHDISWPATTTTYTATYQVVPLVPIQMESLIVSPEGQVHLTMRAAPGQTLVVQTSTNLQSWIDLGTVEIMDELAEFVDVGATNHQFRYYRAKQF